MSQCPYCPYWVSPCTSHFRVINRIWRILTTAITQLMPWHPISGWLGTSNLTPCSFQLNKNYIQLATHLVVVSTSFKRIVTGTKESPQLCNYRVLPAVLLLRSSRQYKPAANVAHRSTSATRTGTVFTHTDTSGKNKSQNDKYVLQKRCHLKKIEIKRD